MDYVLDVALAWVSTQMARGRFSPEPVLLGYSASPPETDMNDGGSQWSSHLTWLYGLLPTAVSHTNVTALGASDCGMVCQEPPVRRGGYFFRAGRVFGHRSWACARARRAIGTRNGEQET